MRAFQPSQLISFPLNAEALSDQPNATRRLLKPLLNLAEKSDFLIGGSIGEIPVELHIGIPKHAPRPSQIHGTVGALKSILDSYQTLLSIGQNL